MMKYFRQTAFALMAAAACTHAAENTATVRLFSESVRVEPATTRLFGLEYRLELTTSFSGRNDELAPLFIPDFFTHGSLFGLYTPNFPEPLAGQLAVDLPPPVDADGDGFDDFFQTDQAVTATTTHGIFETDFEDDGTLTAVWSRAAGSSRGTCRIRMVSSAFGNLPEFTHNFEIIEYRGRLIYQPGDRITATLSVTNAHRGNAIIAGPVALARSTANPLNELTLSAGAWTNQAGFSFDFEAAPLYRDQITRTNYFSYLEFEDGEPETADWDYLYWTLSIDDPNDANGNGIPDLSDPPAPQEPVAPTLRLAQSAGQLHLTISGQTGRSYQIEQTTSLSPPAWTEAATVTLAAPEQTVELVVPAGAQSLFWRARLL